MEEDICNGLSSDLVVVVVNLFRLPDFLLTKLMGIWPKALRYLES